MRHQTQDFVRVEFWQEKHRGAGQKNDVRCNEEAMRVEDREGVDQPVVGREAPILAKRGGVRQEVVMRQHRALGPAGRAGRVEDGGEVIRTAIGVGEIRRLAPGKVDQRAATLLVERFDLGAAIGGMLRNPLLRAWGADDKPRLGIAEEIVQLGKRIGRVERKIDGARAKTGEIEHQRLGALLHLHRHPIARAHPQGVEHGSDASRILQHVAIGPDTAIGRQDEGGVGAR